MRVWMLVMAGLFASCDSGGERAEHVPDPSTSTGTTSTTTTDGSTTTPPTDTTTSTGTTTTTTGPAPVRFVALGDAGTGSNDQFAVADAIETVCNTRGCDFALYLGDNFYDTGVDGPDDSLFIDYFEAPYANLSFPFYVALGNHDYGALGLGIEFWKANYYLDYAANYSTNFVYPDIYYSFTYGNVHFLALNTTQLFFGVTEPQEDWVDYEMANLPTGVDHVIAFGHHPYISNGRHGNAGAYEGIPFVPIVSGDSVKTFFDDHICGNATVYFCGHDHNRQLLEPTCGTEFVVSGAGAKTTDLEGRGNVSFFEDDTIEGFVYVEIDGDDFTFAFYDKNATLEYETVFNP